MARIHVRARGRVPHAVPYSAFRMICGALGPDPRMTAVDAIGAGMGLALSRSRIRYFGARRLSGPSERHALHTSTCCMVCRPTQGIVVPLVRSRSVGHHQAKTFVTPAVEARGIPDAQSDLPRFSCGSCNHSAAPRRAERSYRGAAATARACGIGGARVVSPAAFSRLRARRDSRGVPKLPTPPTAAPPKKPSHRCELSS